MRAGAPVTKAAIERRLVALEAEVAALRPRQADPDPDNPLAWLAWSTVDEMIQLEPIIEHLDRDELTPSEHFLLVKLELAATERMLAGEPRWVDLPLAELRSGRCVPGPARSPRRAGAAGRGRSIP
jgi:hypothetical protein